MDVGVIINHYQVIEHIGRGGMADVWSARDNKLNRMVAIKTIAHDLAPDGTDPVSMFNREAETIANMEHPHILPIYDFGDFDNKLYIVMRYMAGGSLGDKIERNPLPIPDVLRIGTAVAQALDFAHSQNIIHLDLKPQNILLDSHTTPYLADFGLATSVDPYGLARNPGSGTLMFMAPEQLTQEIINRMADVYSFGLVLYNMLTGDLPFDGDVPLAMKQLQNQETLPPLLHLPLAVTDVLRRCSNVYPDLRPQTLTEVMDELRYIFTGTADIIVPITEQQAAPEYGTAPINTLDAELLDAVDIYSRAYHVWDKGNGRFLLGVTHFMVMDSYYSRAHKLGLEIDEHGYQMMLRGALEYDINVEYWWSQQQDDAARRWVCLHAIRSENAPARIRGLQRLETLPDTERPRIPRLIAQALQIETDEQAKLAALQVLGTRVKLLKPQRVFDVLTQYRGRLLTTITRIDLHDMPESDWQEITYSKEIDTLVADIAMHDESAEVRAFAGRIIGRMRSKTAVRYLTEGQSNGYPGALKALAFVRDEAPNLPPEVPPKARLYTWLTNTWRRITDRPLALTWAFLFALLGGWAGIGWYVYWTFRNPDLFAPQRVTNTLGFGLAFSIFAGIQAMLGNEIPTRLRGFWLEWARLVFSVGLGFTWGLLTWGMVAYMFFQNPFPNWGMMTLGALGLMLSYTLTTMLNLRAWLAVLLTSLGVALPVYLTYHNLCPFLWEGSGGCTGAPAFSLSPVSLVGLLVGIFAGTLLRMRKEAIIQIVPALLTRLPRPARAAIAAAAGLAWAITVWMGYAYIFADDARWFEVTGFVLYSVIVGLVLTYALRTYSRVVFALSAVASFATFFWLLNPYMQDAIFLPTIDFNTVDALLHFDYPYQLLTALIPCALFIALGGHAQSVNHELRRVFAGLRKRFAPIIVEDAPLVEIGETAAGAPDTSTAPIPMLGKTGPLRGVTGPLRGGTGALDPKRVQFDFSDEEDVKTEKLPTDDLKTGRIVRQDDLSTNLNVTKQLIGDDEAATADKSDIDAEIARLRGEDQ